MNLCFLLVGFKLALVIELDSPSGVKTITWQFLLCTAVTSSNKNWSFGEALVNTSNEISRQVGCIRTPYTDSQLYGSNKKGLVSVFDVVDKSTLVQWHLLFSICV
jgi:hypothetical protein